RRSRPAAPCTSRAAGSTWRRSFAMTFARACRPCCAASPGSTASRIPYLVRNTGMKRIDLNCDMGESYGAWKMGADGDVMPHISSANIACGFHGGDPATIRTTVRLAVEHGVAIGAHPSLPDLSGFGRRVMRISPQEMYDLVVYQAGAVEAFARAAGSRLHHIKCHGALYNMAANDEGLSEAMVRAAKDLGAMLYVLSRSKNYEIAKRAGVPVCGEVFAHR